jgi:hypothetical protein
MNILLPKLTYVTSPVSEDAWIAFIENSDSKFFQKRFFIVKPPKKFVLILNLTMFRFKDITIPF